MYLVSASSRKSSTLWTHPIAKRRSDGWPYYGRVELEHNDAGHCGIASVTLRAGRVILVSGSYPRLSTSKWQWNGDVN